MVFFAHGEKFIPGKVRVCAVRGGAGHQRHIAPSERRIFRVRRLTFKSGKGRAVSSSSAFRREHIWGQKRPFGLPSPKYLALHSNSPSPRFLTRPEAISIQTLRENRGKERSFSQETRNSFHSFRLRLSGGGRGKKLVHLMMIASGYSTNPFFPFSKLREKKVHPCFLVRAYLDSCHSPSGKKQE